MANYSQLYRNTDVPQTVQQHPDQERNSAGGFAFVLDEWKRLERFLILGSDAPTYYASAKALTRENALSVLRCLDGDPARTVDTIVAISDAGRAPKQGPAIFALALAASHPSDVARRLALQALPRVCRTASHLFAFVAEVKQLRGFGRGLRRGISQWYTSKEPAALAYQLLKYRNRHGFTHRDVLRLAGGEIGEHTPVQEALFRWVTSGRDGFGERLVGLEGSQRHYGAVDGSLLPAQVDAFEEMQRCSDPARAAQLIVDHRLTHEMVPSELLGSALVWEALLQRMPLTALLRNLGRLTSLGVFTHGSLMGSQILEGLQSREALRRARIHPLAVLVAMNTYARGAGVRGSLRWSPLAPVKRALDDAFELSFANIEATGKRTLLALDVSGSMSFSEIAGMTGVTPRLGAAAMAMATLRSENNVTSVAFSHRLVPLKIHAKMSIDEVNRTASSIPMGGTDCALPMIWAKKNNVPVDAFVVYTDNETYFGRVHPHKALERYRRAMGIDAKLVVVGMTATKFSIAKQDDPGMLDVVGFDTAAPSVMADFMRG